LLSSVARAESIPNWAAPTQWPSVMTLSQLERAHLLAFTDVVFCKTNGGRIASPQVGKDLYRQVRDTKITSKIR
jgi:hypothetical protein